MDFAARSCSSLATMKIPSLAAASALALCAFVPALLHAQPGQLKLDYVEGLREAEAPPPGPLPVAARNPAEIEAETGGMLGIAILDPNGALMLGFNREERFALCGTQAIPLAAAILQGAAEGRFSLTGTLPAPDNSVPGPSQIPIGELVQAMLVQGDATARQTLLGYIGGPAALAQYARDHRDMASHIDPAASDQGETTTPLALAGLTARLIHQDLPAPAARQLRNWMEALPAETRLIGVGLPEGWSALEVPGRCDTGLASIALVHSPANQDYVFALYLDHPSVAPDKAASALAEAARSATEILTMIDKRRPQ